MGTELPLDTFHGLVRRAAQSVRSVREYGTCLVSCSDEFNGEVRGGFDRDVARPLLATLATSRRRIFAQSNLGGRIEPGALHLVGDHFTLPDSTGRLLVVEVAGHLGRRQHGHEVTYGELDRFGRVSACCGALRMLLNPPEGSSGVHYTWFEQLKTFFGRQRLEQLRALDSADQMIRASVIHVALQAESAVTEVLRDPPPSATWVLVVGVVIVNQPGTDGALPVSYHLLRSDAEAVHVERGFSLRTTPDALHVDVSSGHLSIDAGEAMEAVASSARAERLDEELTRDIAMAESSAVAAPHQAHRDLVRERIEGTRAQAARLRGDPVAWRVFARPLLRSLFQGLTVVAPEVGLAAMMLETGADWVSALHRKQLIEHGPSSPHAQRVLHEVESSIQQLSHSEAQEVLDVLLAESSPLTT